MAYRIKEPDDDIFQILDSYNDGIYLIGGSHRYVLFDTGMDADNLAAVADRLSETPYDVVFSHAHFDHTGRGGDFRKAYMSEKDRNLYAEFLKTADNDRLSFLPPEKIETVGDEIDLGDRKLKVIPCGGHTPGSIMLADEVNKCVFTGDAIGSGFGVWMQVPGALSLREYAMNLINAIMKLEDLGVNDEWSFYGGHPGQEYMSKVSAYNPLCMQLMKDMVTLCAMLVHGSLEYTDSDAREFATGKPKYAAYGRAEIIFTESQL